MSDMEMYLTGRDAGKQYVKVATHEDVEQTLDNLGDFLTVISPANPNYWRGFRVALDEFLTD